MNALLIYPEFPDTFWSYKHALKFIGKRVAFPPLGLLTVASMLPSTWAKRLVDLNAHPLTEAALRWADLVLMSAMAVQRKSASQIIRRCKKAGLTIVAGGPLFTSEFDQFENVDHFVLNEAELTLPAFLQDLERGCARRVYDSAGFADMGETPLPSFGIIDFNDYASMSVQFSRGCPFQCEFCNVTALLGHTPRSKSSKQILAELDNIYNLGWRGRIFFVDDNFIGNKKYLQTHLLPEIVDWRKGKKHISFNTETSINLADDHKLMSMMVEAGFDAVFIGIETPADAGLSECNKNQNENRNLMESVKRIQRAGLEVQGGFIVGFDSDPPDIFQRQIDFIQQSGIVTAMVGILQAPPGTALHARLKREKRLKGHFPGNTDGTTNIIPRMDFRILHEGYKQILRYIYSPNHYYERVRTFLQEYEARASETMLNFQALLAFLRTAVRLGVVGKERFHYWRLLSWTLCHRPELLPVAVTFAAYGHHFRRIYESQIL